MEARIKFLSAGDIGLTKKSGRTKELIIEKATHLFYKYGYLRAPVRKITKDLNLQNTIIYHYFKSKDELLFTIIDSICDEVIANLEDIIKRNDDPLERLQKMLYYQTVLFKTKKREVKIFVEDTYKLPKKMLEKILKKQRKMYDLYASQLKSLQKAKRIKEIEFPVIIFTIFAMVNWSYRWFKEDGTLTLEDVAERIIQILFYGILAEK